MTSPALVLVTGPPSDVLDEVAEAVNEIRVMQPFSSPLNRGARITTPEVAIVPWEPTEGTFQSPAPGGTQRVWPDGLGVLDRLWTHVVWVQDATWPDPLSGNWHHGYGFLLMKLLHWWNEAPNDAKFPVVVEASIWRAKWRSLATLEVLDAGREAVTRALTEYLQGD